MTRVLLTGGSGDLGQALTPLLISHGYQPVVLDVRRPALNVEYIAGSILDQQELPQYLNGTDVIVHIAAWHGIHEDRGLKSAYDFFDVNVRRTFEIFEAARRTGIKRVVLMSSTSVSNMDTLYGQSKIMSEAIAGNYALNHNMRVVTLRPRAFIPHWNRNVYNNYLEWLNYFWHGAVHISDVAQATLKAIERTAVSVTSPPSINEVYLIDGAYDYGASDLANWDADGPGSTFVSIPRKAAGDCTVKAAPDSTAWRHLVRRGGIG